MGDAPMRDIPLRVLGWLVIGAGLLLIYYAFSLQPHELPLSVADADPPIQARVAAQAGAPDPDGLARAQLAIGAAGVVCVALGAFLNALRR